MAFFFLYTSQENSAAITILYAVAYCGFRIPLPFSQLRCAKLLEKSSAESA